MGQILNIMDNNNIDQGFSNVGVKTKSKVDDLLHQEQDDLAMSLSQSKFLLLKNANLERVKADDLSPDIGEFQQLERMMTKISLGNIESLDDKSPSDTFENIPDAGSEMDLEG